MLKLRPHTSKCLNRALGHLRSNSELLVSEKKGNLKLSWRVVSISHQKFIWTLKMVSIISMGKAVVLCLVSVLESNEWGGGGGSWVVLQIWVYHLVYSSVMRPETPKAREIWSPRQALSVLAFTCLLRDQMDIKHAKTSHQSSSDRSLRCRK